MAKVSLKGLWKTDESNERLEEMVQKLNIRETLKSYIVHLTLFEEEVQHMMKYITEHPTATEDELEAEVNRKTWEVTQKLGLTASERGHYLG